MSLDAIIVCAAAAGGFLIASTLFMSLNLYALFARFVAVSNEHHANETATASINKLRLQLESISSVASLKGAVTIRIANASKKQAA